MRTQYVIISPRVDPQDFSNCTDLLEEAEVDYADLIKLTLEHWQHFDPSPETEVHLHSALEEFLCQHAESRLRDYAHMQMLVSVLESILHQIYEGIQDQLGPLLDALGLDVRLQFTRKLHRDALVRLVPAPRNDFESIAQEVRNYLED